MPNYLLWARRNRLGVNPVGVQDGYVAPNSVRVVLNEYSPIANSPQQGGQVVVSSPPLTDSSVVLPLPFGALSPTDTFAGAFVRKLPGPTITIASPAVVTCAGHGLSNGLRILFNTTGGLPTGITSGGFYFVINAAVDTFNIAPVAGGSSVSTSGAQSGTHSLWYQV